MLYVQGQSNSTPDYVHKKHSCVNVRSDFKVTLIWIQKLQQLETPVTGLLQQLAATEFFTIFIVGNADFVIFDYSFSVSNYDDLNLLSIIGFYFCALGIVLVKMAMFGVVVTFYVTTLHCKLGFNTQFTHSQTHGFNLMHQLILNRPFLSLF